MKSPTTTEFCKLFANLLLEVQEQSRAVMAGWEFEPAMMGGQPVAGELYITLEIKPL